MNHKSKLNSIEEITRLYKLFSGKFGIRHAIVTTGHFERSPLHTAFRMERDLKETVYDE